MLNWLLDRLAKCDSGFVLDIFFMDGSQLLRCGLFTADRVGLVVSDNEGEMRLVPWANIGTITYEEM